jgi:hypothetical protein
LRSGSAALAVVATILASCSDIPTEVESDRSSTISPLPGIFLAGGFFPEIMGPSRVFEGIWAIEFEGSAFYESALKPENILKDKRFDTWLDPGRSGIALQQPDDPRINQFNDASDEFYIHYMRVKFVGRRNVFPGLYGFGHLGVYDKMILVENVISAKLVAVE